MALQSRLFRDDKKLQECLIRDSAHVISGSTGDHVSRIQAALALLDDARIEQSETLTKKYGPSTANAVLSYKQRRKIINFSYQTRADNIVGKMTIAALDKELAHLERTALVKDIECQFGRQ
jgi:peptidoglycan hydrolase-like protein with peptidoglycan-binding domain